MPQPPRIGVLVVAYNAAGTLRSVLERIDPAFRPKIDRVLVSDDHSADDTFDVGVEIQRDLAGLPITVVRQPRNLGYGGNQKFGYRWAVEHGLDIVVMLHGDGQYAPELLADIVGPIESGDADVVMGSRMLDPGGARRGGMPLYKYAGNRILTRVQNTMSGLVLSEWHSGYRAFSVPALARIPFEQNSDGFDFDTEVLLQLHDLGARIAEVPIPTFYGDEIREWAMTASPTRSGTRPERTSATRNCSTSSGRSRSSTCGTGSRSPFGARLRAPGARRPRESC